MSVPTSGAWQSDPQVQAFVRALQAEKASGRVPTGKGDVASPTMQAFNRYITQNRQRLGIPEGYGPSITTDGVTLEDWSIHPYRQAAILGGAAAGPLIAPAFVGAGAPELGNVNSTIDALSAGGAGATAGGTAAATGASGVLSHLKNPKDIASLAATLAPAFLGGSGSNPFGSGQSQQQLTNTVNELLAMQKGRVTQSQPIFDALVSQAHNMTPTAYRSPGGPTVSNPPEGAYQYQAPRFGR